MWWLFNLQTLILPFFKMLHLAPSFNMETVMQQFFMLGLIPGTNFQITFKEIVYGLGLMSAAFMIYKLSVWTRMLLKINAYRRLTHLSHKP